MKVIYEPKGAAREYAELACNLYMGCVHSCRYCYAPSCMRKPEAKWHESVFPRKDIVKLFTEDAKYMHEKNDMRSILFSFVSDPYQPIEEKQEITRHVLQISKMYHLNTKILTKGCAKLIRRDFKLMKQANTQLGITLCFYDDKMRQEWEPYASSIFDRLALLEEAHELGIYTWVSLEPVINPQQALAVIKNAAPFVDFWKIGKLNHMKSVESTVDWKKFATDAESLLKNISANYYIKNSLCNL